MSYDLLHQPWLPCLLHDGTEELLGLRQVLERAPEIAQLRDDSPLVAVSLHRLLLALLHRVCGPASDDGWEALWHAGAFDCAALGRYLDRWHERFDLFHPTRPFYQAPGLPSRLAAPVTRLAPELASGNQPTLFDHHVDDRTCAVPAAVAARWLVSHQNFCLSGCCGDDGGLTAVRSGPLAYAAVFLLTGRNLFETLLLNLLPYDPACGLPMPVPAFDCPQWEREDPPEPGTRLPDGYLDYLTWPARRIWLLPQSSATVARVIVMPGADLPREARLRDPFVAYRGPAGLLPHRLEPGASCWRDCLAVLASRRLDLQPPPVLDRLRQQVEGGALLPEYPAALSVTALSGARARVDSWQHHRLCIPLTYLRDPSLAADLERALGLAEDLHQTLQAALWHAAQTLALTTGDPAPLRGMAAGGPATHAYWRALEAPVQSLLHYLPGPLEHRDEVLRQWLGRCERLAWQELERALRGLRHQPRGLRAEVLARDHLARHLGLLLAPWREVASEAV